MAFCHNCGAAVEAGHRFCPRCGQALGAAAATTPAPNFSRHVWLLAVVLIFWGGLGVLAMLGVLFSLGPLAAFLRHLTGDVVSFSVFHSLLIHLSWVFLAVSVGALAAGMGLLEYKPWARGLAVAVSVLALFQFPLGTVVGIYGLWVLLSPQGAQHYRKQAALRNG